MTNQIENLTVSTMTEIVNALRTKAGENEIKKVQSKDKGVAEIDQRAKALRVDIKLTEDGFELIDKPPLKQRTRYGKDDVIVVLRSDKAKKGSGRNPYAVYRTGMTVGEAVEAGVKQRDINYDASPDRKAGAVLNILPADCHEATLVREAYDAGKIGEGPTEQDVIDQITQEAA
jgi:hypothetical protein